jgi:hypothetical protein
LAETAAEAIDFASVRSVLVIAGNRNGDIRAGLFSRE